MTKKQIQETAKSLLRGKIVTIRAMIDRSSTYEYINNELRELQIQADFALNLQLISDDEHQEIKEDFYKIKDLIKNIQYAD